MKVLRAFLLVTTLVALPWFIGWLRSISIENAPAIGGIAITAAYVSFVILYAYCVAAVLETFERAEKRRMRAEAAERAKHVEFHPNRLRDWSPGEWP